MVCRRVTLKVCVYLLDVFFGAYVVNERFNSLTERIPACRKLWHVKELTNRVRDNCGDIRWCNYSWSWLQILTCSRSSCLQEISGYARGWFFESRLIIQSCSSEWSEKIFLLLFSQRGQLLAEDLRGMKVDSRNLNQLHEFYLLENRILNWLQILEGILVCCLQEIIWCWQGLLFESELITWNYSLEWGRAFGSHLLS
jgi:hypothetical protein